MTATTQLPPPLQQGLSALVEGAQAAFGEDLLAVVLFGSAAEGRLRSASDLNLVIVLRRFDGIGVDEFRDSYRLAHAAARVRAMFLLGSELEMAAQLFPVKITDILLRRIVLYGTDPFAGLEIPRDALRHQAMQMLTNLTLVLRERYALLSLREDKLAPVLGEVAPPLRACAAALLTLEGRTTVSPRAALEAVIGECGDPRWTDVPELFQKVRQGLVLAPGQARSALFAVIDLAANLQTRLQAAAGVSR
ncbi:MAG: hypothetical protein GC191_17150 [Azospirillum sp.]|nr:hypothetical protein [Azospirillum sp.]